MAMAALVPAALSDTLEQVFVVGFGTGVTVGEFASMHFTPRVVVVEYNIFFALDAPRTIEYCADHVWDETTYHGASLAAFHKLGLETGYTLVHTDSWAPNAFFVLDSELPADYRPRPLDEMTDWDKFVAPPGSVDRVWVRV